MCDKAISTFLLALKLVPDWFVTNEMLEKLVTAVIYNDDIFFVLILSHFLAMI